MTLLWAGIVVLCSHAAEAVTGFGCTVLALPFVSALLGVNDAVKLLSSLAWIIALYFVVTKWDKIHWKQYVVIAGLAALGLPAGIYLRKTMGHNTQLLKQLLAVFIIVVAAVQIGVTMRGDARRGRAWPLPAFWIFLVLGGCMQGMFGAGGPLVVLYATRALPDKGQFRATLCLLWVTLNSLMLLDYARDGQFDQVFAGRLGAMLPFLAGGIVIGELIHHRVNPIVFQKTVFGMLLAVGVVMLVA